MLRFSPNRSRIFPCERVFCDRAIIANIGESNGGAVVFGIERDPAIQSQSARRAGFVHEYHRDGAIFGALWVADFDTDNVISGSGQYFAKARKILTGV